MFLAEIGVSGSQVSALFAIDNKPGCLMKELASLLLLQNSAITGLISRMEESGLIVREPCSNDGRASRLYLSARGKTVVKKAYPLLAAMNVQLKDGFSAAEIDVVARFLNHAITVKFEKETAK